MIEQHLKNAAEKIALVEDHAMGSDNTGYWARDLAIALKELHAAIELQSQSRERQFTPEKRKQLLDVFESLFFPFN